MVRCEDTKRGEKRNVWDERLLDFGEEDVLTFCDRIQITGDALELAGCCRAIGGRGCGGRSGRSNAFARNCATRARATSRSETKVFWCQRFTFINNSFRCIVLCTLLCFIIWASTSSSLPFSWFCITQKIPHELFGRSTFFYNACIVRSWRYQNGKLFSVFVLRLSLSRGGRETFLSLRQGKQMPAGCYWKNSAFVLDKPRRDRKIVSWLN